jgi:hypothetical protein
VGTFPTKPSGIRIAPPRQTTDARAYATPSERHHDNHDTGSNSSLNAEYVVIGNADEVFHSVSG